MMDLKFKLIIATALVFIGARSDVPRELPGEEDSFESIRTQNKVYVDKSHYITKLLARSNRFIRICRPRRFGKSNFVQMLESFFTGDKKSLFADLSIGKSPDRQAYPVIYLDFNVMDVNSSDTLQADLGRTLVRIAATYGVKLGERDPIETQLEDLVKNLSANRSQSVVVLVDEYDWPVRRHIEFNDMKGAHSSSLLIKKFFAHFALLAPYIKLFFMTCTMQLDLEDWRYAGGLRAPDDLTLDPEFGGMIGMTEDELTSQFEPHITAMVKANETFHSLLETLRRNYRGYCFSRDNSSACQLYNFHSVVSCLRNQKVDNYWHRYISPRFNAIDDYRRQRYALHSFNNRTIPTELLQTKFDHDEIMPTVLCLVLRGYLTFSSYDPKYDEYELDFPNEEVRETFVREMTKNIPAGRLPTAELFDKCAKMRTALSGDEFLSFINALNDFALVKPDWSAAEDVDDDIFECTERITRLLQTCDIDCAHECHYFHDIILDLVVESPERVEYVFEIAWNQTAAWSFNKLLNISRIDAFQHTFGDENVYLVGMNFNPERGVIDEWIKTTHTKRKCSNFQSSHPHYLQMYSYMSPKAKSECVGLLNE